MKYPPARTRSAMEIAKEQEAAREKRAKKLPRFGDGDQSWTYDEWLKTPYIKQPLWINLVYKFTHKDTGHFYIGKHAGTLTAEEFLREKYYYWGSGTNMVLAKKILPHNWKREIIHITNSGLEIFYIESKEIAKAVSNPLCLNRKRDLQRFLDELCNFRVCLKGLQGDYK
jgi:hypothetical protein